LLRGLGRYLRHRSVENVIEELKELKAAGARTINVSDDTFAVNKKWTLEFLDRYAAEVALPFIVNARAELLDEEVTRQLGVAGCHCVQVGVESGSQEMRDSMLGRPLPDETLIQAAERAHGAGIRLLTYNMVGLPGETLDQAFKTMRINTLMKTEFPRVSIFQPYPGTPLGDQAREMGLVRDGADMGRFSDSYFRSSVLSQPDIEAMVNLQKFFYPAIRFPRLEPVIRRLIKLPPNLLFQALYLVSIGAQYMRATRRTPLEMLRFGLKNLGSY